MSNPITVETTPIMIRWGKDTVFDWSDDVTYYYKEEMVANGTAGNRTFDITVLRSDTPDFSVSTEIGTRNKITGAINLTNGAPVEEKYLKTLTRKLKGNASALNTLFSQYETLSNDEQTTLNAVTGTKNVATNNENTNTTGTEKKEKVEMTFGDINIGIKGRRFRKEYENLSYPEGLGSNRQDRIRFEQIYSEGKTIEAGINLEGKVFQRNQKRINGSVTLPIVTGIGDKNEVDWQGATLNPLQALGASGALSLFRNAETAESIGEAFSRGGTAINEAAKSLKGTVGRDMQSAINIYLAQKAVGAQGLLSRASGAILNPNLEMLFSGPSLRNFDFTFKLSPRDANEADQVRKIIRFFKQGMSVKTSSSNVFLKAPNIFKIRYQTFNTNGDEILHPSLNIIKECALKSCDVQYTPDGTYMTYDDPFRTMTSYQLSLSFGELDPIYDSDYTELDQDRDQVIGY